MVYKIKNGSVTLGNYTVLECINFEIKNNERIGIVGNNGCGKTTLLKAIYGDVEILEGIEEENLFVSDFPKEKIGYIRQDAIMDGEITLLDEILKAYQEILDVEKKLNLLSDELSNSYSEKRSNQYQDLYLYYKNIGGYSYKKEYETALLKFGFSEDDKYKLIKEFSYGQRTKIAFLRLILSKPELLLLDEPTNHLDISAIEWLEEYLSNYSKMLVIVSHDRMFLDNVCNIIYEISYGCLEKYPGNYSYYERQKKLDYEKVIHDYKFQQKEIERLRGIADRFRYKPTKAKMALSKLKQIERMTKIDLPLQSSNNSFYRKLEPNIESYRDVLKVKELKIGYDEVLGEVNFCLERGERLGIIGDNGCGKSTFLKTIMENIPKLGGKYTWGNRVEIGYFDQNVESLILDYSLIEFMEKCFPILGREELRGMLGSFGFTGEMVFQKIDSLSGGQKVKLLFCKIINEKPNVLILDEPTNHLDIFSKEKIEELLLQYKGTVIFVSHDRYFTKKIATNLLVFENNNINYYKYGYDYYLDKKVNIENNYSEVNTIKNNEKVIYKSEFKEKSKLEKKLKKIENEIQYLEEQINNYQKEMMKEEVYLDINKLNEINLIVKELELKLNDNMRLWEELMYEVGEK